MPLAIRTWMSAASAPAKGKDDKTATIVAAPSIKPNVTDFMKASLPVAAAHDLRQHGAPARRGIDASQYA